MQRIQQAGKRFFAVTAMVSLCLAKASAAFAGSLPVAYAAISGSHAALWVAKEAGYFDKQGNTTDLIYLGGGQATKVLPIGTAYAVWTGIGAAGTAILGMIFFKEPATAARLVCLLMIVGGVAGLKVFTPAEGGS